MISPLRAKVIATLEAAGYRNSEDYLPAYADGGTFSAIGTDAISVTCRRWEANPDELAELRAGILAALRAGGLEVAEEDRRLVVQA
jgi:hypothetical protein